MLVALRASPPSTRGFNNGTAVESISRATDGVMCAVLALNVYIAADIRCLRSASDRTQTYPPAARVCKMFS